ncbi:MULTISPECIES: hypothetical protein [unclassified Caballeronia]|uniref:hypothetical protein n=1 Tax=unclassified Caballeronia TaxID=2646786 RepID=UPI002864371A|nr:MULTISPECIES: hypothetical protein [unclassified Caballeronia]MDR5816463.1 hypothetical protein [Caballeronia sp. LZ033]MDR5881262.1 hypothetical protein [Caballeronia sp. LZ032]
MLSTNADMTLYQPDPPVVPPPPTPEPARAGIVGDSDGLTRIAERAQQLVQNDSAAIIGLLDPARRKAPTTSEMLMLQSAVTNYSVTLNTLSHMAQSAGSAIQSLTQRT